MPGIVSLADWRRIVSESYGAIRAHDGPLLSVGVLLETRHDLFTTHAQSPIPSADREGYQGPFAFTYDPAARVRRRPRARRGWRVEVGTSDGRSTRMSASPGRVSGCSGRAAALEVFWLDQYGGGIYLAFRDATSGERTYGGGRYLLDTVKGADLGVDGGRLVLDFNFAYQPWCSYDPSWSCPLPHRRTPCRLRCPWGSGCTRMRAAPASEGSASDRDDLPRGRREALPRRRRRPPSATSRSRSTKARPSRSSGRRAAARPRR